MTGRNVRIIFEREIRDQLRDRRTLMMVAVLPVLLYPLLGVSFFQISQVMRPKPSRILVIGAQELGDPPLFEEGRFAAHLFRGPEEARQLEVEFYAPEKAAALGIPPDQADDDAAVAAAVLRARRFDAVLRFPPLFARRLEAFREEVRRAIERWRLERSAEGEGPGQAESAPAGAVALIAPEIPHPQIIFSTANERSTEAGRRLNEVLMQWREHVGAANLSAGGLPPQAAKPFRVQESDVAQDSGFRGAALWSKIMPVLLVVWALTGAFYPAVDLCAGEKERGTLETLLSSPAERIEVVLGKLGAVMVFSMATAVLNLVSMGLTGWLALGNLPLFAPPPWSVLWLIPALIPASAVFSSLALGIAAFARSTKEGQYYLLPLLFLTLPLVGVPVARGLDLTLGTSLVPVTGLVLLLKALIEGEAAQAWPFVFPVAAVTLGGCYYAIRWAALQFNNEQVLFRDADRFDLRLWLRHLFLERRDVPSPALAVACGILILFVRFVLTNVFSRWQIQADLVRLAVITQMAVIAAPVLLMTLLFARSVTRTWRLHVPSWRGMAGAILLAFLLQPTATLLQQTVTRLYPLDPLLREYLLGLIGDWSNPWLMFLAFALLPAVCEETAFRGFILSGLRQGVSARNAVVFSAIFFGLSHTILQQSITAFAAGLVLGTIALVTRSLWPCIAFHAIHNSLTLGTGMLASVLTQDWGRYEGLRPGVAAAVRRLGSFSEDGFAYHPAVTAVSFFLAAWVLLWVYAPSRLTAPGDSDTEPPLEDDEEDDN